jgi:hypothetical protein
VSIDFARNEQMPAHGPTTDMGASRVLREAAKSSELGVEEIFKLGE